MGRDKWPHVCSKRKSHGGKSEAGLPKRSYSRTGAFLRGAGYSVELPNPKSPCLSELGSNVLLRSVTSLQNLGCNVGGILCLDCKPIICRTPGDNYCDSFAVSFLNWSLYYLMPTLMETHECALRSLSATEADRAVTFTFHRRVCSAVRRRETRDLRLPLPPWQMAAASVGFACQLWNVFVFSISPMLIHKIPF